jgi:hypothetical protein
MYYMYMYYMYDMKPIPWINKPCNQQNGNIKRSEEPFAESIYNIYGMQEKKSSLHLWILEHSSSTMEREIVIVDVPYRSVLGSLTYLMIGTWPDLPLVAGILSQLLKT